MAIFKLTMQERIALLNVLPPKGGLVTMRTVKRIRDDKLLPSDEEIKETQFQEHTLPNGQTRYTWNPEGQKEREVELHDLEVKLITDCLLELSKKEEVYDVHVSLFDKLGVEPQD